MLDTMHYSVNEDGQSCFQICIEDFGVELELCATLNHPNAAEWETTEVESFQNDVNLLVQQARTDMHRLIQAVSRNHQLEAAGLPPEFVGVEDADEDEADA